MLGVAERELASDESGFLGGLPVDLSDPADVAQDEVFALGSPSNWKFPWPSVRPVQITTPFSSRSVSGMRPSLVAFSISRRENVVAGIKRTLRLRATTSSPLSLINEILPESAEAPGCR